MNAGWAVGVLAVLAGVMAAPVPAAQPQGGAPAVISSDAIEAALQKPAPAQPADEPVMKTRGLRLQARSEESRASEGGGGGSVDLQIAFAVDSAQLLPEAQRQLGELAKALRSERLAGRAFQLAGHTDATGRADHNRALSLARANSVRDYLAKAGVDTATLSVAGYGADRLLEGRSPNDPLNRRVEIRSVEPSP